MNFDQFSFAILYFVGETKFVSSQLCEAKDDLF